jgi:hypothetical protein
LDSAAPGIAEGVGLSGGGELRVWLWMSKKGHGYSPFPMFRRLEWLIFAVFLAVGSALGVVAVTKLGWEKSWPMLLLDASGAALAVGVAGLAVDIPRRFSRQQAWRSARLSILRGLVDAVFALSNELFGFLPPDPNGLRERLTTNTYTLREGFAYLIPLMPPSQQHGWWRCRRRGPAEPTQR